MTTKVTTENVDKVFGSVKPVQNEAHQKLITEIVRIYTETARAVIFHVPDSARRSTALQELINSEWACIDAIAKGGD